jgi:hypothetical protein
MVRALDGSQKPGERESFKIGSANACVMRQGR